MNGMSAKVPFNEKIELYCWDKRCSVQATELGAQRLTITPVEPLAGGSMVTLRIKLPDDRAFTVLGRVLGSSAGEQAAGPVEIDFIDIKPSDRRRILAFVGSRRSAA